MPIRDFSVEALSALSGTIELHWKLLEDGQFDPKNSDLALAIDKVIDGLDDGSLRVANFLDGRWVTNGWIKKAILLSFRISENRLMPSAYDGAVMHWYDKVDLKMASWSAKDFADSRIRAVPGSYVRRGTYVGHDCVLMPSFINVGAYIGDGTMVDIWATVGSCAQIGKKCHISANVCIGGVLEPIVSNPVIIEDGCVIGAGSQVVEGVVVESGSVISAGVTITGSTRIINRESGEVFYGRVPANSVVVPGSVPSQQNPKIHVYAAIIVKEVDERSREKVSLNDLLRPAVD